MRLKISIAVVQNKQNEILVSLRRNELHQGGKWEFPGGKVDIDESSEQAMLRELSEEVGLVATEYKHFKYVEYNYPDKKLSLDFYHVTQFTGIANSTVNQAVKWVDIDELQGFDFPDANKEVIEALQLILQPL